MSFQQYLKEALNIPETVQNIEDLQNSVKIFVEENTVMKDVGSMESKMEPVLQINEISFNINNADEFGVDEEYEGFTDTIVIEGWEMTYNVRLASVENNIATYEIEVENLQQS